MPLLAIVAIVAILARTDSEMDLPRVRIASAPPTLPLPTEPLSEGRIAPPSPEAGAKSRPPNPRPVRVSDPPRWAPGEEERHFKWLRETSDPAELERELDEFAAALHEKCAAEIRRRVAAAEFERILPDDEGRYPVPPPRRGVVEFVSGGPDLGLVRVHIPEAAAPEAYEIQRRIDWLRDLLP